MSAQGDMSTRLRATSLDTHLCWSPRCFFVVPEISQLISKFSEFPPPVILRPRQEPCCRCLHFTNGTLRGGLRVFSGTCVLLRHVGPLQRGRSTCWRHGPDGYVLRPAVCPAVVRRKMSIIRKRARVPTGGRIKRRRRSIRVYRVSNARDVSSLLIHLPEVR